jgi:GAF domain-containing protein
VRGQVIGAIDIQSKKINAFGESDIEVMQTLADQLSIAIESTRLFTESEAIISQFKSLTTLQTRDAWVNYLKRRAPAYQYTHLGVRPLTDARAAESQTGDNGWYLRVPIELRGNEIGIINLRRKETSPAWSNREHELAKEVAAQVALALDTSRLLEETQKSAARDQMIANVSGSIRETLDMESVLQTAATELRKAFDLAEAEVRLDPPPTTEHAPARIAGKTKKKPDGSNGKGDLAS